MGGGRRSFPGHILKSFGYLENMMATVGVKFFCETKIAEFVNCCVSCCVQLNARGNLTYSTVVVVF